MTPTVQPTPNPLVPSPPAVAREEVRAALLWALDHDVASLEHHRRLAHFVDDVVRRRRSDAQLVAAWRRALRTSGTAHAWAMAS